MTRVCLISFLICFNEIISLAFSDIVLEKTVVDELKKWSSSLPRPHFVMISHSIELPCGLDQDSSRLNGLNLLSSTNGSFSWIDFEGLPILADRHQVNNGTGTLFLKHVQPEDTRRMFCQLNSSIKYEHYLIVYDVPHIMLEYSLEYRMPMCLDQLIKQKASNIERLIEHNAISLHHGLIYTVRKTSCYYSDKYVTAIATIEVSCEDRRKDFKPVCDNLDCYYNKTRNRLLKASIESARRWSEVEAHPQYYRNITDKYVRMPEFTLTSEKPNFKFSSICSQRFELWNDILCVPCLAGSYYDNYTLNCSKCPANSYQTFDLMMYCYQCPRGKVTNSTGISDIKFCSPPEAEYLKFIHKNVKFLIILAVTISICVGLIYYSKMKENRRLKKEKLVKDEEDQPLQPLPALDLPNQKEYFVGSGRKVIEVSKVDFLMEAQEKRRNVKPKFDYYAFRL